MKILDTPENNKKFNALYFGQPVQRGKRWPTEYEPSKNFRGIGVSPELTKEKGFYLELTSLSNITEEDSIEVVRIRSSVYLDVKVTYPMERYGFGFDFRYKSSARRRRDFVYFSKLSYKEADYLRSKGYYVGDGEEIEYEWAVLK